MAFAAILALLLFVALPACPIGEDSACPSTVLLQASKHKKSATTDEISVVDKNAADLASQVARRKMDEADAENGSEFDRQDDEEVDQKYEGAVEDEKKDNKEQGLHSHMAARTREGDPNCVWAKGDGVGGTEVFVEVVSTLKDGRAECVKLVKTKYPQADGVTLTYKVPFSRRRRRRPYRRKVQCYAEFGQTGVSYSPRWVNCKFQKLVMEEVCKSCDYKGGETKIGGGMTYDQCAQSCFKDPTCVAIDFGKGSRQGDCFLNTQATVYNSHPENANFDAWRKVMFNDGRPGPNHHGIRRRVSNAYPSHECQFTYLKDEKWSNVVMAGSHNSNTFRSGCRSPIHCGVASCFFNSQGGQTIERQGAKGSRFFSIDLHVNNKYTYHGNAWYESLSTIIARIDRVRKRCPLDVFFLHVGDRAGHGGGTAAFKALESEAARNWHGFRGSNRSIARWVGDTSYAADLTVPARELSLDYFTSDKTYRDLSGFLVLMDNKGPWSAYKRMRYAFSNSRDYAQTICNTPERHSPFVLLDYYANTGCESAYYNLWSQKMMSAFRGAHNCRRFWGPTVLLVDHTGEPCCDAGEAAKDLMQHRRRWNPMGGQRAVVYIP